MTDWEDFMRRLSMERFSRYQPPKDTEGQIALRTTSILREAWGRAKKEEPREDSAQRRDRRADDERQPVADLWRWWLPAGRAGVGQGLSSALEGQVRRASSA